MNFGYQFFTTFTGSPIINSDMLILNHFFIFINGLIFVLGENRYQNKMTDMFPAFYSDKTFGPKKSLIHYLFELLMTFLESVWILYFTIFTYYKLRNKSGIIGNVNMISISVSLGLQFLTSFKFVIRSDNSSPWMFLYTLLQTGIMVCLITFIGGFVFMSDAIDIAGWELFTHLNSMYILIGSTLISVLFSWVIWEISLRRLRFPVLCDVEDRVRSGDLSYLIPNGDSKAGNANYLKKFVEHESFSSIVANTFSNTDSKHNLFFLISEEMDMTIENILSSTGSQESINITKYTLSFHTFLLEKKYKIFTTKRFFKDTQI